MLAASARTDETQLTQMANQVGSLDRADRRHLSNFAVLQLNAIHNWELMLE
jgi:hypothetical protein